MNVETEETIRTERSIATIFSWMMGWIYYKTPDLCRWDAEFVDDSGIRAVAEIKGRLTMNHTHYSGKIFINRDKWDYLTAVAETYNCIPYFIGGYKDGIFYLNLKELTLESYQAMVVGRNDRPERGDADIVEAVAVPANLFTRLCGIEEIKVVE